MEAVLQRPRIYIRGNVFSEAKDFFTNVFNRRKLRSKVKVDDKAVNNTNARVISVEQTINVLSSIFSLESMVELYEQRIENTNKRINELKIKINNCTDSEKARLQKELDNCIENLKVDSYILESKKEELNKDNEITNEPPEPNEPFNQPEPNEPPGQNEPPQNNPNDEEKKDESQDENQEYTELYSTIKSLFEDKINLSAVRLERITNIINFINSLNVDADDLQGKLAYITYFNKSFIANYEKEISVDEQLNEKIKKIYEIKPDFNINEEFGELTRRISMLSENMTHNYEKIISDKKNYLEQIVYSKDPSEHETIIRIIQELDNSLNNLKSSINEPNKEETTTQEKDESPKSPESNGPNESNENDNQDENKEYEELYNSIKSLLEDKINLSSVRLERITNITNFIENIEADDLQSKLTYITNFNKSYIPDYEKEISVDQQLNEKIKKIYEIKPGFNINEEFGELTKRIATASDEMIHNCEKIISNKMEYLELIVIFNTDNSGHEASGNETIRELLKELGKSLNYLKYNINEPNIEETTTQEETEPPKSPDSNEPSGKKESFENDNQDDNIEYAELYSSIESLFEDKINLSSARVKRIERLPILINGIDVDSSYLEGFLNRLILINIDSTNNYDEEVKVDRLLNEKIKKISEIKPNFSINEEFGELTSKIVIPSEDMINNCKKTILDKKNYLEEIVHSKNSYDHETIRNIIKEFDKLLSNLKNYMSESNILETPAEEIVAPLLEDKVPELVVNPTDNHENKPEEEPFQLKKIEDVIQGETPNSIVETIPNPAEEQKERLLKELNRQYSKLNNINNLLSNPSNMTCEAIIYFEEIASNTHNKISEIRAILCSMSNVLSHEIEYQEEVFPGPFEDFFNLHKERINRADNELQALKEKNDKEEKDFKRIDILKKFLTTEKEIIHRRATFEMVRGTELNISDYLYQLYHDQPEEQIPVTTNQHVEQPRIRVAKPQKVNKKRAFIGNYQPYIVERLQDSIKIIINSQARQELKKTLGDIKVIINNNQGLNGVKVNIDKTKDGNIIENISNLDSLDNLKIVIENNGQEIKSEEIISNGMSK